MAKHDDLLNQGPREAPEPETVEEQSRKRGLKTVGGGGIAAGGLALAKVGILGKVLLWLIVWHGAVNLARIGGWIGIVLAAAAVTVYFVLRSRRTSS